MAVAAYGGSSVEPDVRAPVLPEVFMLSRPRRGLIQAAVIAAAVTGFVASAQAQLQIAPVDLEIFRPAMDSKGFITVNSSGVLGEGDLSFGLVTSYARKPLVLNGNGTFGGQQNQFAVNNLVTPSLQAAVGFTHLPHLGFELGVVLPLAIISGQSTPSDQTANGAKDWTFTAQGIGDLQVHPKIRLMNATRNGLGLAIIPSVILPTGDKTSFLGEGQWIFQPTAVIDTELGYLGRFRAAINGGMRIRQHDAVFTDNPAAFTNTSDMTASMPPTFMTADITTHAGISIGNEFIGGLGLSYGIVPQKFDLVGEVYGNYGTNSNKLNADGTTSKMGPSAEAIAGIKLYLARNSFFELGGGYKVADGYGGGAPRAFVGFIFEPSIGDRDGDGYKDDVDQCPDDPEDFDDFEDADGCPDSTTFDRDGDGIPDDIDKCPDDPEDKDNFEDADGCPDPDNDNDRILDKDDKCPNEPETYNGYQDADGCPDKGKVIVHKGKLEILDKIYFETDKDEIKSVSFPLLDAIAATINGNPQIEMIEIQGHADERGDDAHNLDLTERRAHSVRVALEQRNVLPSRLKSHGYGETKPICMQHNEDCWSQNRRVEFIILKRSDEAKLQGGEGQ